MIQDLHVHTTWSDGSGAPREMIERAIHLGLERIAITDHSYLAADEGYCLPLDTSPYVREIRMLAKEYADRIDVLCGIEQDFYSPPLALSCDLGDSAQTEDGSSTNSSPRTDDLACDEGIEHRLFAYDWVVGSVHYVRFGDALVSIDDTPEIFERAAFDYCEGDFLALAECYFETVAHVVERTGASIVGHFDLVKKFNERYGYFDESSARYCNAWKKAADMLLETGVPFEINTGGISRGWRTDPYPSPAIQKYLESQGAVLIYSSDAHSPESVYYGCRE